MTACELLPDDHVVIVSGPHEGLVGTLIISDGGVAEVMVGDRCVCVLVENLGAAE